MATNVQTFTITFQATGDQEVVAAQQRIEGGFSKMGVRIVVFNQLLSLARQGLRAFTAALEGTIGPGRDFEKAMARSTAIMGDLSGTTKKAMNEIALSLSGQFVQSAEEAAKAYFFLASAGLDAESSMAAMRPVMEFATAGAFDLATATDLLTDAQSALGKTIRDDAIANTQEMIKLSDQFVTANTLANASVQQFAEALANKGGAALKILGKSSEEGLAVLTAFADQGNKGSAAGESLNQVLRDLPNAVAKAGGAWKEAGLEITDAEGNLKNMADIVDILTEKFDSLSDVDLRKLTKELKLQDRSIIKLFSLLGTGDFIRENERKIREGVGATADVAAKQLENFSDQVQILKNELDNIKTDAFLENAEDLREMAMAWREFLDENRGGLQEFFSSAVDGFESVGNMIKFVLDELVKFWNQIPEPIRNIMSGSSPALDGTAGNVVDVAQLGIGAYVGGSIGAGLGAMTGPAAPLLTPLLAATGATIGGGMFFDDAMRAAEDIDETWNQLSRDIADASGNFEKIAQAWDKFLERREAQFSEAGFRERGVSFEDNDARINRRTVDDFGLGDRVGLLLSADRNQTADPEALAALREEVLMKMQETGRDMSNLLEILDRAFIDADEARTKIVKYQENQARLRRLEKLKLEDDEALKERNKLRSKALSIIGRTLTPMEKLYNQIQILDEAERKGAITTEENMEAQIRLADAYDKATPEAKAAAKAANELADEQKRLKELGESLRDQIDPSRVVQRNIEEARKTNLTDAEMQQYIRSLKGLGQRSGQEFGQGMENAIRGLGDDVSKALSDGILKGTMDGKDILESFAGEIIELMAREMIFMPILDPIAKYARGVGSGEFARVDAAARAAGVDPATGQKIEGEQMDSIVRIEGQFSGMIEEVGGSFQQVAANFGTELGAALSILFGGGGGGQSFGDMFVRQLVGAAVGFGLETIASGGGNIPGVPTSTNPDLAIPGADPGTRTSNQEFYEAPMSYQRTSTSTSSSVYTPPTTVINQTITPTTVVQAFSPQQMQQAARANATETKRIVSDAINQGGAMAKQVNRRQ